MYPWKSLLLAAFLSGCTTVHAAEKQRGGARRSGIKSLPPKELKTQRSVEIAAVTPAASIPPPDIFPMRGAAPEAVTPAPEPPITEILCQTPIRNSALAIPPEIPEEPSNLGYEAGPLPQDRVTAGAAKPVRKGLRQRRRRQPNQEGRQGEKPSQSETAQREDTLSGFPDLAPGETFVTAPFEPEVPPESFEEPVEPVQQAINESDFYDKYHDIASGEERPDVFEAPELTATGEVPEQETPLDLGITASRISGTLAGIDIPDDGRILLPGDRTAGMWRPEQSEPETVPQQEDMPVPDVTPLPQPIPQVAPLQPEAAPLAERRRPPEGPTRDEVEEYRQRLELRLLERYNNLPEYAGNVGRVEVVLSKPVEPSLDGSRLRAEFDQLVYDPWGRRIPKLEEEYFVVTFAAGGAQQVRSDPSIRVGLEHEKSYSEQMPLNADPFVNVQPSKAFAPSPKPAAETPRMADWWRPDFPEHK